MRKSVEKFTKKVILPSFLLSGVAFTTWNTVGAWIGSNRGGEAWVGYSDSGIQVELESTLNEIQMASMQIPDVLTKRTPTPIKNQQSLIYVVQEKGKLKHLSGLTKSEAPAFLQALQDLQYEADFAYFKNHLMVGARYFEDDQMVSVARILTDQDAAKLQKTTSTEILLIPNQGKPLSTFRNTSGDLIVPSPEVLSQILAKKKDHFSFGKMTLEFENYGGYSLSKEKFSKNEKRFSAFYGLAPIRNRSGVVVAHVLAAVPEDVMLYPAKQALLGSIVLLFLIVGIFSYVTLVYAVRFDQRRKNLESLLDKEKVKSMMNAKLASLGELAAGIAHEINNPLAIVEGMARNLEKFMNDPEKLRKRVENIHSATKRISKIVASLERFSRYGNSGIRCYEAENIQNILREAHNLTEMKARRHQVKVELRDVHDAFVMCDAIEIEQVLINLINNGIDAVSGTPDAWVVIEMETRSGKVLVRVRDSGQGIPKEEGNRIFEPFHTTKPVGKGTGLGLSIAKGILDGHGAEITLLEGETNTCFEICFDQVGEKKNAA